MARLAGLLALGALRAAAAARSLEGAEDGGKTLAEFEAEYVATAGKDWRDWSAKQWKNFDDYWEPRWSAEDLVLWEQWEALHSPFGDHSAEDGDWEPKKPKKDDGFLEEKGTALYLGVGGALSLVAAAVAVRRKRVARARNARNTSESVESGAEGAVDLATELGADHGWVLKGNGIPGFFRGKPFVMLAELGKFLEVLTVVEPECHLRLDIFGGVVDVWRCHEESSEVFLVGPDVQEVVEAAKQYCRDYQHQCLTRPGPPARLKLRPVALDAIRARRWRKSGSEGELSESTRAESAGWDDAIIGKGDAPLTVDIEQDERLFTESPPVKNTFINYPASQELPRSKSF